MIDKIYVNIKNETIHDSVPTYWSKGAAGFDVRANIENPIVLKSLDRCLIPTGISLEIPEGYEAVVRPRSGRALKEGLTVLNTPGTIDSDYRGEIGVILINLSKEDITIAPNSRIAQVVFSKYYKATFIPVLMFNSDKSLNNRGQKGFGSSGND
jgi:dUTP pyrophosphatase